MTKGNWEEEVPNKWCNLTECPCYYMDRFTPHGKSIREAYENAVVNGIAKFFVHPDAAIHMPPIHIVVMGSGGLSQEAMWLRKLFSQKAHPTDLSLHLVDTIYKDGEPCVHRLVAYAATVVPRHTNLHIHAWNSYPALQATLAADGISPHLAIGIDTDDGTAAAKEYQKSLLGGDLEKVLFIKHEPKDDGEIDFHVYHRQGKDDPEPAHKKFNLSQVDQAAKYIEVVGASF